MRTACPTELQVRRMNGRGRPFDDTGSGSATWVAGETRVRSWDCFIVYSEMERVGGRRLLSLHLLASFST